LHVLISKESFWLSIELKAYDDYLQ